MFAYGAAILNWIVKAMSDAVDWLGYAGNKLTTDPIWGGTALGIIVVMVGLIVLKKRASG